MQGLVSYLKRDVIFNIPHIPAGGEEVECREEAARLANEPGSEEPLLEHGAFVEWHEISDLLQ